VAGPVDVSVNWTSCPALGDCGDHVKLATGLGGAALPTVIVDVLDVFDPLALVAIRFTK
jgi:hypothetical protein